MNKLEFLERLKSEQANWEAFLRGIPLPQREQANLYGTWRVKDVVGHVAAWERYMTARLHAHLRGDAATVHELWGEFIPSSDLSDDALNNWMAQQIGTRSFDEILGMQREVRNQLIGTVQAMQEADLLAIGVKVKGLPYHEHDPFWQVIRSMSYGHAQHHTTGLEEVL